MAGYVVGGIVMIIAAIVFSTLITLWALEIRKRFGDDALRHPKVIFFLVLFYVASVGLVVTAIWLFASA